MPTEERDHYSFFVVIWFENFLASSLVCRNLWQTAIYTWQKECHLFYSLYKMCKCTKCPGSLYLAPCFFAFYPKILPCILKLHILFLLFSFSGVCFLFSCEYESWSLWENERALTLTFNDRAYFACYEITWFILVGLFSRLILFMLLLILKKFLKACCRSLASKWLSI